ncbi:MAG TPA: ATP-binding protein [Kofleriaceae bacterium]|jgi:signal transduction histidine kinase|nr:ATP-binding protein [Kofleriaceae bacterium]
MALAAALADFNHIPIPAGICELDGTIIYANSAAGKMLARAGHQIVGRMAWDMAPGAEHIWQEIVRIARERGEYRSEITVATPDGPRAVEYIVVLRQIEGRTLAVFFGIVRESARRDDVQATHRLEALGLVAGGIAHEFNNQLTTVLAEASAARESSELPTTVAESLRRIEDAANRMAQLTRQLLAYAGRGRFVAELLDPDQLLIGARDRLAQLVRSGHALNLVTQAPGAVVDADRALLFQIVANLVANASEAYANGGSIAVETRADGTGWWQAQVRDRGIGIDTETIPRIWDPFFTTKVGHHGLGLSAVAGIVRRLGGEILVESKLGVGSTFTLRLPVIPGAQPNPEPTRESPPRAQSLAGKRALIADDEPAVRTAIRRLLERRDAIVVLATDGTEAAARLRDGQFHIIVLDVMMPGLTGYQLLPIARETNPAARVMLMSGYAEPSTDPGEVKPNSFLEKPFTSKSFDDAIDDLLR